MIGKNESNPVRFPSSGRLAPFVGLILILSLVMSSAAFAQGDAPFVGRDGQSVSPSKGDIGEVPVALPMVPEAVVQLPASLVRTIQTSTFSPPGADPTGITYLPSTNTLLIADADVDERWIPFQSVNLFEISLSGTLIDTSSTMAFSMDPETVSLNPSDGHLFVADDDANSIFEVDPGVDGRYGTGDDIVITSFSTAAFGSLKPLGVAYSSELEILFIADYTNAEVYKLTPGDNDVFDGVSPEGDDEVTSFDTYVLGMGSLEGIAFNATNGLLYICDKWLNNRVAVVSTDGTLLWMIDISAASPITPSDLTLGPGSQNPGVTHVYISDRGVEVWEDPAENDGRVYEMTLPFPSDAIAPNTTLTATPPDPDSDNTPTFSFSGSDPGGSGVGSFQCQLDGGGWSTCTSPHTTAALTDGEHTFSVRAVDNAGNPDLSPASYTWTVDTTAPDTAFTATPPDPDSDSTPTFSFSGSDGGSGVAGFECQLDGGGWSTCTSPYTTAALTDGGHTFSVGAVDNAGNADASPDTYTWTVDTTPPDTAFTDTPPDLDDDSTPTFEFEGSDGGSGVASFECQLDGGGWSACVSPYTTAPLSDGEHTFSVRALDNAGNVDPSPDTYTWKIAQLYRVFLPLIF